jgi:hypothetical protein
MKLGRPRRAVPTNAFAFLARRFLGVASVATRSGGGVDQKRNLTPPCNVEYFTFEPLKFMTR